MSTFLERIRGLSQKQLAVLALRLNEELEQSAQRRSAPIAVVGIGCRLPGGITGPDSYWQMLQDGREAISEIPRDRWDSDEWYDPDPDVRGRISAKLGGFLDDIAGFDAESFGITPREAATMDPQQRLLLEVAWETLEHGGIDPASLSGSATGVFVGVCNSDHFHRVLKRSTDEIDAYVASGNAPSVVAGRISYVLGLAGPALAIDTACSSSLVALHQAVMSLRAGSCDLALAGGVNVICEPETMVSLSQAGMLAPDGRCKAFDAAADGFARGEGCGLIALKRLSDAERDNDRIHAVIRGSALNQDGRSAGLTVPSRRAQEAVIQSALADAGIAPEEVGYVEAHGTGTRLGDPIEIRALAAALTRKRTPDQPLIVGSAKTNFGHLESAAGIAGTIKTILALEHGKIPKHLHFHAGNPEVDWDRTGIEIAATAQDWPAWASRRVAGVSSFGFSGTNAHLILEAAPAVSAAPSAARARCLPVSARTPAALNDQAGRLGTALAGGTAEFAASAATLATGRAQLPERLAIVAGTASEAAEVLGAVSAGGTDARALRGHVEPGDSTGVVFLCTGQGAQYPGMARTLFDSAPAFREIIERCDAALGPQAGGLRLIDVMRGATDGAADAAPVLHRTEWTQPALYAVECGLAALWRSFGVEPAAVIGHSAGEFVAASIAGVFSLEDGLRLVAERGRILSRLPEGGAMAALFMSEAEALNAIARHAGEVSIAAVNARDGVVISGTARGIDDTLAELARAGVQGHRLHISFAAHSPMVDGALDEMERAAASIAVQPSAIPVAWNLTGGRPLPGGAPDAGYWRRHLREPVRFADGMSRLRDDGHRVFLELGPHPVLAALAARDTDDLPPADRPVYLGSLRREHDDWAEISRALAGLFVNGVPVDWAATGDVPRPRPVALPTYPFEHRRFWIEPQSRYRASAHQAPSDRPIPGHRLDAPDPVFESRISTETLPWLAEHEVHGSAMVAGPVYLSMALGAAQAEMPGATWDIADFAIAAPMRAHAAPLRVQTRLNREPDGTLGFTIHSRPDDSTETAWVKHATGRLIARLPVAADTREDLAAEALRLAAEDGAEAHLDKLATLGIRLSGAFRTLDRLHRTDGEVVARIARADGAEAIDTPFCDPGLLDGVLQAAAAALPQDESTDGRMFFLTGIARIVLDAPLPARSWCHARLRPGSDGQVQDIDATLHSEDGTMIGQLTGIRLTAAESRAAYTPGHYHIAWHEAPVFAPAARLLRDPVAGEAAMQETFSQLAELHGLELYDRLLPALDDIARAHTVRALKTLGIDSVAAGTHDMTALADRLSVVPGQRRLFARLVQILAEAGLLSVEGDRVTLAAALPTSQPLELEAAAERSFGRTPELSILSRSGAALAEVLAGSADPLECLFPGGSLAEARALYVEAPFARTYNGALGALLRNLTTDVAAGERLRVLEIGGGTGGTTGEALAALDDTGDRKIDYLFTDVSQHFLDAAMQRSGQRDGFSTALLDIERDPPDQGLEPGQHDIVLAANVLHATRDLGASLAHAAAMLAPGGVLLLLEGVRPELWVDLTFGMTPGWWRFTDSALRPDYPLISPDAWRSSLAQAGLTGIAAFGGSEAHGRGGSQQMLIAARKPPATRRRVAITGADSAPGTTLATALETALKAAGAEVVGDAGTAEQVLDLSVLSLAGLDAAAPDLAAQIEDIAVLAPLRRLNGIAETGSAARLWVATTGMHAVGDTGTGPGARWQSPVAGIARVAALEVPGAWGGLIDLDPSDPPEAQAAAIARSLLSDDAEDQCAWRHGDRHVPRLLESDAVEGTPLRLDSAGTYLVTGGFGGIGATLAQALAERGAGRVALLGRNPDPDGPAMAAVRAAGAEAIALQADVSDPTALAAALDLLTQGGSPIRGAFHAAAHLDAAPLAELDRDRVQAMLRPKISGTLALEQMLAERGAEFLVLFSSTTAVLGAPGFAHYAAANAFLDASDTGASNTGLRVLSIGWGTWEKMRLATEEAQRSYGEQGLRPMRADAALDALFGLVAERRGHSLVAAIDWERLVMLHETRRPRPMLSELGRARADSPAPNTAAHPKSTDAEPSQALRDRLSGAPASARLGILASLVATEAAAVMGKGTGDDISRNRGLFDMGMDSLMSVELRRRLEQATGLTLPATLTFNHPTVDALATFIEARLQTEPQATTKATAAAAPKSPRPIEPDTTDLDMIDEDELVSRLRARLEELQ